MEQHLDILINQYGLLLVFAVVLVEQVGVPLPSLPVLLLAGALAATGHLSAVAVIAVAFVGCLIPDLAWYAAGRRFGGRVMRLLCRLSLSPDSCIHRSEQHFARWRGGSLLVAKFVPGLSLIAPPLAGALGLPLRAFITFDGIGALLWVGIATGIGYAFAGEIDRVLGVLGNAGSILLDVALGLLAIYITLRWWRRRRARIALQIARISVDELHAALATANAPLVVDARTPLSRQLDPQVISGAVLLESDDVAAVLHGVPHERAIVSYCSCPNEATAAKAASTLLRHGYRNARPLQGGLDAWKEAGYPTITLTPAAGTPVAPPAATGT